MCAIILRSIIKTEQPECLLQLSYINYVNQLLN